MGILSTPPPALQVDNLKKEMEKVRTVLANKENETAESIQEAASGMQKASLKLFEMAYKKVRLIREGGLSVFYW